VTGKELGSLMIYDFDPLTPKVPRSVLEREVQAWVRRSAELAGVVLSDQECLEVGLKVLDRTQFVMTRELLAIAWSREQTAA
jgi:hypothetical protein